MFWRHTRTQTGEVVLTASPWQGGGLVVAGAVAGLGLGHHGPPAADRLLVEVWLVTPVARLQAAVVVPVVPVGQGHLATHAVMARLRAGVPAHVQA